MAEMLSNQFTKMFSKPIHGPFQENDSQALLSEIVFSVNDIIECIDELRSNAAPGFDVFSAIVLKRSFVYH